MALMMNTLGRAQAQSEAQEKSQQVSSPGQELELVPKEKVTVEFKIPRSLRNSVQHNGCNSFRIHPTKW